MTDEQMIQEGRAIACFLRDLKDQISAHKPGLGDALRSLQTAVSAALSELEAGLVEAGAFS